jgi:hypothetical protein
MSTETPQAGSCPVKQTVPSTEKSSIWQTSNGKTVHISSVDDLILATQDRDVKEIQIHCDLEHMPSFRLAPGQTLSSARGQRYSLRFLDDSDGIQLTSDNCITSVDVYVSPSSRALWNDSTVASLGRLAVAFVLVVGRVQILIKDRVRAGHIMVRDLDILAADATAELDRPHAYGVFVRQGAFTLWNMQTDQEVVITADIIGISAGRVGAPVFGSGIFVGGAGDQGGRLNVQHLQTGGVYSDGRIPPGTADQITGGVFTVYGAYVELVLNEGPVVTYGPNDMALDNWGTVDRWLVKDKVTTFGESGIGFVNFGKIGLLHTEAPIETFGAGARGFNVYAGTVDIADFDRILTHADGAVGVQISQPIGQLRVHRGIETFGGSGPSLVKGIVQTLSAVALSIKPGGTAQSILIEGGLTTHGENVVTLEQQGRVSQFSVIGNFGPAISK